MSSQPPYIQPSENHTSGEVQTTNLAMDTHFPSLIFRQEIVEPPGLNASLLQFVLGERAADSVGLQLSNVAALGGWHSRTNLHKEAIFKPLVETISIAAETVAHKLDYHPSFKLSLDQMWAVVNPPGAFNRAHLHPHSLWSGVYYVQLPDNAGRLLFDDPRPGNVMFCAQSRPAATTPPESSLSIAYEPRVGHLILFPGFLQHSVEPNQSTGSGDASLRVAIAFNLAQH